MGGFSRLERSFLLLLENLSTLGVDWAVLGGLAVAARTEPRFTRDIDIAVAVRGDDEAERKLNRAASLIDKPADALEQLTLAQTRGIELVINKSDDPLVEVQHALRLAERMVEEGKHETAKDNLRLAQIQLSTYRALVGKEAAKAVKQLENDITALMPKIKAQEAAATIRKFWERAVSWFREEPGQARVVEKGSSEADTAAKQ